MVEPGDAADQIVDAVRRDVLEISIPGNMHYTNRVSILHVLSVFKTHLGIE